MVDGCSERRLEEEVPSGIASLELFSDIQRDDILFMHSQAVGSSSFPDNKSEKQPIPLSVERV
ncbi:MAG: hypothetical protein JW384_01811 [Nitrosomonadaceae bacterium]|nr:hypothetical protein [Nitrosomonadaceae bacterium]